MGFVIAFLFSLWIKLATSRDYSQVMELMKGGKMVLHWEVEEGMFFFKLSGITKGHMGLAFSYNDIPEDGFVAGVDGQGDQYVSDLHLDHVGRGKEK